MVTKPLSAEEIRRALETLPGWEAEGDVLTRSYVFKNFREAMGFMVRAGFEAEAMDHHPEWTNIYNRVDVRLTTHAAGNKVTARDVELAGRMDGAAGA